MMTTNGSGEGGTRSAFRRYPLIIGISLLAALSGCSSQPHWPAQHQATLTAINLLDPNSLCTIETAEALGWGFMALLGAGLLTGLSHCVGMCGPLAGAFVARRRAARQEVSTPLVLFQTGRLLTYLLLGLLAGGLGNLIIGTVRGWQGFLSLALGLMIALVGLGLLGWWPLQQGVAAAVPGRVIGRWIRRLLLSERFLAPVGLGLANGLLPCGPVYAMALLAASSGSPIRGAGIMLVFGLGTLPAMLGFGLLASWFSLRLRSQLYRVAAVLMVLVGLQLALRGLALEGQISHIAIGSVMIW